MYDDDIENKIIFNKTIKELLKTEKRMKELKQSEEQGIQQEWINVKDKIKKIIIQSNKSMNKGKHGEKKKLKNNIAKKLEELENATQEHKEKYKKELQEAKEKLADKTRRELNKIQEAKKARYRLKGEKCTKYWFNLNKKKYDDQTTVIHPSMSCPTQ